MSTGELTQGLLSLPGSNYETKALVEQLLEEDAKTHHCFFGKFGFHNHLPHHLLAAYDLGATAKLLQAIYDQEKKTLSPINLLDRKEQIIGTLGTVITKENWTEHIGFEKNYIAYLDFFKDEIQRIGVSECLEEYVFSAKANGNNNNMLLRLVAGAVHPLIQIGHGIEFNVPLLVATGLAQTAVTNSLPPSFYIDNVPTSRPPKPASLFSLIKQMYDSEILTPVLPYDSDALISKRSKDAQMNGRPQEIGRISAQLFVDPLSSEGDSASVETRVEEIIWTGILLTFGTGKWGRKPRLDFFLMHVLTSSLFLPSMLKAIKTPDNKSRLLRVFVSLMLYIMLLRGRPRIDAGLAMAPTAFPQPPVVQTESPSADAIGDPRVAEFTSPWPALLAGGLHAPDAHTVKVLRTLYYASKKYGDTPPGKVPGALDTTIEATNGHVNGKVQAEIFPGTAKLDGTLFVRCAGVLLNTLGWVSYGQPEGKWDRSALGWDAAWDNDD